MLRSEHKELNYVVFGKRTDGTFTDERGLVGLAERREAQFTMLKWILASSILGNVATLISIILRH